LKNLDAITQDHNESIKTLRVDLEKQGAEILDTMKNQNEKMKEEIKDLKTKVDAKIDVVDKKLSEFMSFVNFQLKENKKLTDDFSLRLKYLDKKTEESDENFQVIQEKINIQDSRVAEIENYNESFTKQITSKFEDIEKKFGEFDNNFSSIEKSVDQIISEMTKNLGSDSIAKLDIKRNNFVNDLDSKITRSKTSVIKPRNNDSDIQTRETNDNMQNNNIATNVNLSPNIHQSQSNVNLINKQYH